MSNLINQFLGRYPILEQLGESGCQESSPSGFTCRSLAYEGICIVKERVKS